MKGQVALSLCASLGIHVGGALLAPWPDGAPAPGGATDMAFVLVDSPAGTEDATTPSPAPSTLAPETSPQESPPVATPPPTPQPATESTPAPVSVTADDAPPPPQTQPTRPASPGAPIAGASPSAPNLRRSGGNTGSAVSMARYRARASLSYPASALRKRAGGTVLLWVQIDENGRATDARVKRSSGFPDLDAAAIDCARLSTYEPARVRGVARPCLVEAPFRFDATAGRQ